MKEIYNNLLNTFFHKNIAPHKKGAYAVERGDYVGEFFVYIETKNSEHFFLSLPKLIIRKVPANSFHIGLKEKIIVFVEKLPDSIYRVCYEQYKKNYLKENSKA